VGRRSTAPSSRQRDTPSANTRPTSRPARRADRRGRLVRRRGELMQQAARSAQGPWPRSSASRPLRSSGVPRGVERRGRGGGRQPERAGPDRDLGDADAVAKGRPRARRSAPSDGAAQGERRVPLVPHGSAANHCGWRSSMHRSRIRVPVIANATAEPVRDATRARACSPIAHRSRPRVACMQRAASSPERAPASSKSGGDRAAALFAAHRPGRQRDQPGHRGRGMTFLEAA